MPASDKPFLVILAGVNDLLRNVREVSDTLRHVFIIIILCCVRRLFRSLYFVYMAQYSPMLHIYIMLCCVLMLYARYVTWLCVWGNKHVFI